MSNIQTSTFVKKLAANDRPTRLAALESLKKFLSRPRDFPLIEFEKLWKGLFYAMWFSDKPRPQQRLAVDLAQLFTSIPIANLSKFTLAFWIIISREWAGIDHHRLDKFLLLVRRVVYFQLKRLQAEEWNRETVEDYLVNLKKIALSGDQKIPAGIPYHLVDIYADELERMMFDELEEDDGEDEEARKAIIAATPLKTLISPFEELSKNAKIKTLRNKVKEDLLEDKRLIAWGVIQVEQSADEAGSDEEDDEWNGFE